VLVHNGFGWGGQEGQQKDSKKMPKEGNSGRGQSRARCM